MESSKHGYSETSTDENDQSEKIKNENPSTRRSYGCTFCKRGFTNAQALGGHMNIHRKDKAKAKKISESSISNKSIEEQMGSKCFVPNSSPYTHYYVTGAPMNYQMYFPNPNFPYYYDHGLSVHEEGMDGNLSMPNGARHVEDGEGKKNDKRESRKEYEVDLELRLGHQP